jgi:hypothetical protein
MKHGLERHLVAGLGGIALGLAATAGVFAADAPASVEQQSAMWQQHKVSFDFLGFTSTYSCDGLADKLKILLLAAGARPDVKSQPGACASSFGRPDKFARADLTFYTLIPADAAATSGGKTVDGAWHHVALTSHQPRELATGDCELVEQFKSTVLPMFDTRNLEEHSTCIPHQDSGSVIDLKFDALVMRTPTPPGARAGAATQGR